MALIHDHNPAASHRKGKLLPSTTHLNDVNRCAVRPDDLIAHQGYSVLVTDTKGWIGKGLEGVYLHQTRFLSGFHLRIEEAQLSCVSANTVDHHAITAYHLAPSPAGAAAQPPAERQDASGSEIVQKAIEVQVNAFCGTGLHLDVIVTNHGLAATDLTLVFELEADFADFNEALAGKRQQKGLVARRWRPATQGGTLELRYLRDDLDLASHMVLDGVERVSDLGSGLACPLHLAPQSSRLLTLAVHPHFLGTDFAPFYGTDGAFDPQGCPPSSGASGKREPRRSRRPIRLCRPRGTRPSPTSSRCRSSRAMGPPRSWSSPACRTTPGCSAATPTSRRCRPWCSRHRACAVRCRSSRR